MKRRKPWHNYHRKGTCMITLVVEGRRPLLGMLVSAAIATREKEVMREAMNRGYRLIFVRENGFPPLYKPSGESFYACSDGRLLQVCPWEYHMERRRISREKCLMLNRLVEDIVGEGSRV